LRYRASGSDIACRLGRADKLWYRKGGNESAIAERKTWYQIFFKIKINTAAIAANVPAIAGIILIGILAPLALCYAGTSQKAK